MLSNVNIKRQNYQQQTSGHLNSFESNAQCRSTIINMVTKLSTFNYVATSLFYFFIFFDETNCWIAEDSWNLCNLNLLLSNSHVKPPTSLRHLYNIFTISLQYILQTKLAQHIKVMHQFFFFHKKNTQFKVKKEKKKEKKKRKTKALQQNFIQTYMYICSSIYIYRCRYIISLLTWITSFIHGQQLLIS